jgi:hypothetical protein
MNLERKIITFGTILTMTHGICSGIQSACAAICWVADYDSLAVFSGSMAIAGFVNLYHIAKETRKEVNLIYDNQENYA